MKVKELKSEIRDRVMTNIAMFKKEDGTFSHYCEAGEEDKKRALNKDCELFNLPNGATYVYVADADCGKYGLIAMGGKFRTEYSEKAEQLRNQAASMAK